MNATFAQGDKTYDRNIAVTKTDFYDITDVPLQEGTFTLRLTAQEEEEVYAGLSDDLTFGSFEQDGLRSALRLRVTTSYHMDFLYAKFAFVLVSLALGIFCFYQIQIGKCEKWIMPATAGIICCQLLCKYTSTLLNNEAFYEIPTAYIGSILNDGWDGFWLDDAGYMPYLPKLLCLVFVKGLHLTRYTPLITSILTVAVISMILAFVTSERFKDIAAIEDRFLFALLLGCTQLFIVESELVLQLNLAYLGGILTAYIYMLDLEKQDIGIIPWMVLSGLLVMSKGTLMVLFPILMVVLVICLHGKYRKTSRYTVFLLAMLSLQAAYILWGPGRSTQRMLPRQNQLLVGFFRAIWVYGLAIEKWLFRLDSNTDALALLAVVYLTYAFVLLFSIRLCFKKGARKWGFLLVSLQAAAFGQILISEWASQISRGFLQESGLGWNYIDNPANLRHAKNVILIATFLVILMFFAFVTSKQKHCMRLVFILMIIEGFSLYPHELYAVGTQGNWSGYGSVLESGAYAIPVNGNGIRNYFLKNNSYILCISKNGVETGPFVAGGWHADESMRLLDSDGTAWAIELPKRDWRICSVYAAKTFVSQTDDIWCEFLGEQGNVITKEKLITASRRKITGVGVIPEKPVKGATGIRFVDSQGQPVDLSAEFYIVYERGDIVLELNHAEKPMPMLGRVLQQPFVATEDASSIIAGVMLGTYGRINMGTIWVELCSQEGQTLAKASIDASELKSDNLQFVTLNCAITKGESYMLKLYSNDFDKENFVAIYRTYDQSDVGYAIENGEEQDYRICTRIYSFQES